MNGTYNEFRKVRRGEPILFTPCSALDFEFLEAVEYTFPSWVLPLGIPGWTPASCD